MTDEGEEERQQEKRSTSKGHSIAIFPKDLAEVSVSQNLRDLAYHIPAHIRHAHLAERSWCSNVASLHRPPAACSFVMPGNA